MIDEGRGGRRVCHGEVDGTERDLASFFAKNFVQGGPVSGTVAGDSVGGGGGGGKVGPVGGPGGR